MSYQNSGIEYTTVTAYTNPSRSVFWQNPYTPQQYAAGYGVYKPQPSTSTTQSQAGYSSLTPLALILAIPAAFMFGLL